MHTRRRRTAVIAGLASALTAAAGLAALPAEAATPACGNQSLTITHTPSDGAAGHGALVLLFQNTSASSCHLYGYPGLDALRPFGRAFAHATRTRLGYMGGAHVKQTVVLAPGAFASATVEWLNFDPVTTGSCEFSAKIGVTAPNTTRIVRMPGEVSGCQLQVHPTVAGSSGRN